MVGVCASDVVWVDILFTGPWYAQILQRRGLRQTVTFSKLSKSNCILPRLPLRQHCAARSLDPVVT